LQVDQARLSLSDSERSAAAAIEEVHARLGTAAELLVQATAAERHFRAAMEAERARRRLAQTTLIELFAVEDRYDAAQLALVQAQWDWATELAQWQFETGSLLDGDGATWRVRTDRLQSGTDS
jgi:outer membrane protein TolC